MARARSWTSRWKSFRPVRARPTRSRKLYERFVVQEYWVVDPELDAIKVYRRDDGVFARAAELTAEAGDFLTTPLLSEFSGSLADLFAMSL